MPIKYKILVYYNTKGCTDSTYKGEYIRICKFRPGTFITQIQKTNYANILMLLEISTRFFFPSLDQTPRFPTFAPIDKKKTKYRKSEQLHLYKQQNNFK